MFNFFNVIRNEPELIQPPKINFLNKKIKEIEKDLEDSDCLLESPLNSEISSGEYFLKKISIKTKHFNGNFDLDKQSNLSKEYDLDSTEFCSNFDCIESVVLENLSLKEHSTTSKLLKIKNFQKMKRNENYINSNKFKLCNFLNDFIKDAELNFYTQIKATNNQIKQYKNNFRKILKITRRLEKKFNAKLNKKTLYLAGEIIAKLANFDSYYETDYFPIVVLFLSIKINEVKAFRIKDMVSDILFAEQVKLFKKIEIEILTFFNFNLHFKTLETTVFDKLSSITNLEYIMHYENTINNCLDDLYLKGGLFELNFCCDFLNVICFHLCTQISLNPSFDVCYDCYKKYICLFN